MAPVLSCSACGVSGGLNPHLRVAGDAGPGGLIPTTDRFGTALGDIVRCSACGHMQLDRMPPDGDLEQAYTDAASDDYVDEEAGQRETARRALDRIEAFAPNPSDRPRALVDLGCWVGFLLAEAGNRGWRAVGVEPSTFAAEYAREELGVEVLQDDLFTAPLPDGEFDALVLGDVIEHLIRPGEALDRAATLLAPSGVAWLTLPDAGSRVARSLGRRWWSVIPTHVQYFTRTSIGKLLLRHGWEVLEIRTAPKAFTVRYYLERVGGYSRPLAGGLVRAAEAARLADRMWAPDFRDRMAVVARRPG
jgi:SAM-dependent methyltransferase